MALFHFHAGFISRSSQASVTSHVAYIGGKSVTDEVNDVTHSYKNKPNVAKNFIILPKNAPDWAKNSQKLWNQVEKIENEWAEKHFRGDQKDPEERKRSLEARDAYLGSAQTAFRVTLALQKELTLQQNEGVLRQFIRKSFTSRGLATEAAIHWEEGNPHGHLVVARRAFEGDSFASKKDRQIVSKASLVQLRHCWADIVNKIFEKHNINVRILVLSHLL